MAALAWLLPLGPIYLGGVALVAALLIYEQSLVSATRSLAGEARVRSERLGRHPVFRDDRHRVVCPLRSGRGPAARQGAREDRGHVRRDRRPLRPAQHGAVGRPRSLLAAPRDRVAAADRARAPARRLHRHGGCRDRRRAPARRGARRRRRLLRRDADARPRQGAAAAASRRASSWCAATRCACRSPSESVRRARRSPSASATCMQPEVACRELLRVLRPGGRLAILEFGTAGLAAVRPLYLWYFAPRPAADRPRRVAPRRAPTPTCPNPSGPFRTATSSRGS